MEAMHRGVLESLHEGNQKATPVAWNLEVKETPFQHEQNCLRERAHGMLGV